MVDPIPCLDHKYFGQNHEAVNDNLCLCIQMYKLNYGVFRLYNVTLREQISLDFHKDSLKNFNNSKFCGWIKSVESQQN